MNRSKQLKIDGIRPESKSSAVTQRSTAECLLPCTMPHHTKKTLIRKWKKKDGNHSTQGMIVEVAEKRSTCENN